MAVWITSALYSTPKLFWVKTVTFTVEHSNFNETICIADRDKHNSEILDMISFALLYVMPLSVMTVSKVHLVIKLPSKILYNENLVFRKDFTPVGVFHRSI